MEAPLRYSNHLFFWNWIHDCICHYLIILESTPEVAPFFSFLFMPVNVQFSFFFLTIYGSKILSWYLMLEYSCQESTMVKHLSRKVGFLLRKGKKDSSFPDFELQNWKLWSNM